MTSNDQSRVQSGCSEGGQFASVEHPESLVTLKVEKVPDAPLADYRVVGIEERPGGTCAHCGTMITVNVLAQHRSGGEIITIGTTCAERIGMDPETLKMYLKERREAIRDLRYAATAKAMREAKERQDAEDAAHELELAGEIGPHGTVSRYEYGCRCDDCRSVAPHGTADCFYESECSCDECVAAALADDSDLYVDTDVTCLINLATGEPVLNARLVRGQYGSSWLVPEVDLATGEETGDVKFLSLSPPKRRSTAVKKGFTYARGTFVLRTTRYSGGDTKTTKLRCLVSPTVDDWGEPVAVPDAE